MRLLQTPRVQSRVRFIYTFLFSVVMLVCTSCKTSVDTENISNSQTSITTASSSTQIPTPLINHTTTQTTTSTPISQTTSTPKEPTPNYELSPAYIKQFLFLGFSSDCKPPCWNELKIGESHVNEVFQVIQSEMKIEEPSGLVTNSIRFDYPDNLYFVEYFWQDQPIPYFGFIFSLNKTTHTLESMQFYWFSGQSEILPVTPYQLLNELGAPQFLEMAVSLGQARTAHYGLRLYYEQGAIFSFVKSTEYQVSENDTPTLELCFTADESYSDGTINFVRPLDVSTQQWTPLQEAILEMPHVIGLTDFENNYVPVQELISVTVDAIVNNVQIGNSPCYLITLAGSG